MSPTLDLVLAALAVILFALDAAKVQSRVNLTAAGLALFVLTFVV